MVLPSSGMSRWSGGEQWKRRVVIAAVKHWPALLYTNRSTCWADEMKRKHKVGSHRPSFAPLHKTRRPSHPLSHLVISFFLAGYVDNPNGYPWVVLRIQGRHTFTFAFHICVVSNYSFLFLLCCPSLVNRTSSKWKKYVNCFSLKVVAFLCLWSIMPI